MQLGRLGLGIATLTLALCVAAQDAAAQGAPLNLKINEVNVGEGTLAPKTGPFIEIINTNGNGATVALNGYRLALPDDSTVIDLNPVATLSAGDYWVVCGTTGLPVPNCDQMSADLDTLLANTLITLEFELVTDTYFLEDDVDYDPVALNSAEADPVTRSGVTSGRFPNGFDTNADNTDFQLMCPSPGAINARLGLCGVVVNEVDYVQGDAGINRFIELAIYDDRDIGCGIVRVADPADAITAVRIPETTPLTAGSYYVLCDDKSAMPECDLQFDESADAECSATPTAALDLGSAGKHGVGYFVPGRTTPRIDSMSYLGTVDTFTEGSVEAPADIASPALISVSRVPDIQDSDQTGDDWAVACATPGAANAADLAGCVCGTGIIESPADEECDEGGENTATCDSDCTLPVCGDGIFNAAAEVCDGGEDCDEECNLIEGAFARGSGGCNASAGTGAGLAWSLLGLLGLGMLRRRRAA